MHNWEHYSRLPAYLLAATLVASCGGGGDGGILSANGQSTASIVEVPKKVTAGIDTTYTFTIKLQENGVALADKVVTAKIESGRGNLTATENSTDSEGNVSFSLKGTGDVTTGYIAVAYKDSKGNIALQRIPYEVVDGSKLKSTYTITNAANTDIVVPTSGNTKVVVKLVLRDLSGNLVKGGFLNFSLPTSTNSMGRLDNVSAFTDNKGEASVVIEGLNQTAGFNNLIVTYKDPIGSTASTLVPFRIVNKFDILLSAETTNLRTGRDTVKLTATVFSASRSVVKDAKVAFQVLDHEPREGAILTDEDCPQDVTDTNVFKPARLLSRVGSLTKNNILTNDNGQAETNFTVSDNNNGRRRILVTVSDDGLVNKPTACIDLDIQGTVILADPTVINTNSGQANKIRATVQNGRGEGVPNIPLTFTGVAVANAITGVDGSFQTGDLKFTDNVDVQITSPNLNISPADLPKGTTKVSVSSSDFRVFFVDKEGREVTEYDINSTDLVTIRARSGKPSVKKVKFLSTLGTVQNAPIDLDLTGDSQAEVKLRSIYPGKARVDVIEADTNASLGNGTLLFVSKVPAKMNLQASVTTLKPDGQSVIEAEVLDENDNPVKGSLIEFQVLNPLGGSLSSATGITDETGQATVTFTAGATDTAKDGVQISALVRRANGSIIQAATPVKLTVGGKALFVTIASGNTLQSIDETTYGMPLSVAVTDAVGLPIPDSQLTIQVLPVRYFRGQYQFILGDGFWVPRAIDFSTLNFFDSLSFFDINTTQLLSPYACPAEDQGINGRGAYNGILDDENGVSEDRNGDGELTPKNPVTVVGNLFTNDAGRSAFTIQYGKSYANWLEVQVIASTTVSGSEAVSRQNFVLPALSTDINNGARLPPGGRISPYGRPSVLELQNRITGTSTGTVYRTAEVHLTSKGVISTADLANTSPALSSNSPPLESEHLDPCTEHPLKSKTYVLRRN